jgi:Gpi18-like mannosyltransferase
MSLRDCLLSTKSDYTPLNNYFFIFFAKISFACLYSTKIIQIAFEILGAWMIVKIVEKITGKKQSPLIFAAILLCPLFYIDTTVLDQCDSIYTFFGLVGLYYMFCKKSILAYWFFGVSLSIKVQAILIFPIILILLFAKNKQGERYLDWRYLWVIMLPYFVLNCVPLFVGKSFPITYGIYFRQFNKIIGDEFFLSSNPNIPFLFNKFSNGTLLILFTILTVVFLGLILQAILKKVIIDKKPLEPKDILFLMLFMQITIILFIPRFFMRYNYYLVFLGIIYALVSLKKSDIICAMMLVASTSFTFVCILQLDAWATKESIRVRPGRIEPQWLISDLNVPSWIYISIIVLLGVFIWYSYQFYKEYIHYPLRNKAV